MKATRKTCDTILNILDTFCANSGQRGEAQSLSFKCGMFLTNDLGIYLGAPIIHGRIKKDHFKHVIEKVKRKPSGWKTSNLSLAGRGTLIQTVTASIPNYTMQIIEIPKTVCQEIDRLNKKKLWRHTEEKKKIHNVKWENVCMPKKHGGLGLQLCEKK